MTPSWFSNSLEQRTDLRKVLYLLLLVYYEGYNSEAAKWKRCQGETLWEGVARYRTAMSSPVYHPWSLPLCSPTRRFHEPPHLGVCMAASFRRPGSLNPWALVSTQSPAPLPQRLEVGLKVLASNEGLFWWPAPILQLSRVCRESPHWNKRPSSGSYYSGNEAF